MKRTGWFVLALTLLPVGVAGQQSGIEEAARTITEADFGWRVGVIAHDSMQGRNTPSPGLNRTADWIASEFSRLGLRGGADDGAFIQRYPLNSVVVDTGRSTVSVAGVRLTFGPDVLPLFGTPTDGEAGADLVLVSGQGTLSRGAQSAINGKHVAVLVSAEQASQNRQLFQIVGGLRGAGAASVLVTSPLSDEQWAGNARRALQPSVSKGWLTEGGGEEVFVPILQIRTSALESMLQGRGIDLAALQDRSREDLQVHDTGGLRTTVVLRTRSESITAPNVVAILDGSDPELANEYVVFSGHMDHVGMGAPDANGDSIFNGADDDASGTVAVMEVAEAMAALPTAPRRSMMFLLVSGEEKGLWGSEWFAENPTVPIESLTANLNTDMVGRNWADTIVVIGKEHSDLGESMNRVNSDHPELRMTAIDDLWPEERFYFRSDHYNFAKKGVPILFFFNGTHDDYHGRDDEPDRIDAEKAARIAKLVFYLGMEIGNADERPKWNPESYARIVSEQW
jgi:hypothetical protein